MLFPLLFSGSTNESGFLSAAQLENNPHEGRPAGLHMTAVEGNMQKILEVLEVLKPPSAGRVRVLSTLLKTFQPFYVTKVTKYKNKQV